MSMSSDSASVIESAQLVFLLSALALPDEHPEEAYI